MGQHLRLNFGPPSLSRVYCRKCKEETLHVMARCNHCKTKIRHKKVEHPKEWGLALKQKRQREAMRALRAKIHAQCEAKK